MIHMALIGEQKTLVRKKRMLELAVWVQRDWDNEVAQL